MDEVEFAREYDNAVNMAAEVTEPKLSATLNIMLSLIDYLNERMNEYQAEEDDEDE